MEEKLKLISMADIAAQEVKWLWHSYVPIGKITILQGEPGRGKNDACPRPCRFAHAGLGSARTDRGISAVVHEDDTTPRMHLSFCPITEDGKLWAKSIIGDRGRLIASRPKVGGGTKKCPFNSVFSGLLHCADCGASLPPKYEKYGRTDIDRTTKKPREAMGKSYYACLTHIKLGKKHCTSHKIEAIDLYELVLRDIHFHAARALKKQRRFMSTSQTG